MQGLGGHSGETGERGGGEGSGGGQRERTGRSQAPGKDLSHKYEKNEEARRWMGACQTLGERQVQLEDESRSRRWGRSAGWAGRRAAESLWGT